MVFPCRRAFVLISMMLVLVSCERWKLSLLPDAVIVRVYRDRKSDFARQLDHKFYDFTSERHRVSSGKWIWVATVEPSNYKKELGGKVPVIKPQMIVLDGPADAGLIRGMDVDLRQATSACGSKRSCPAFIPHWVSGEEPRGYTTSPCRNRGRSSLTKVGDFTIRAMRVIARSRQVRVMIEIASDGECSIACGNLAEFPTLHVVQRIELLSTGNEAFALTPVVHPDMTERYFPRVVFSTSRATIHFFSSGGSISIATASDHRGISSRRMIWVAQFLG
jgi:hypothetical protein